MSSSSLGVDSTVEEGKLEDKISTGAHCLRDVIKKNPEFYHFACLTGFIRPQWGENPDYSWTNLNLRYRMWVNYLHGGLMVSSFAMIWLGVASLASRGSERYIGVIVPEFFGILLQNLLLYPVIFYLRREFAASRDINWEVYNEAFQYAIRLGKMLFVILTAMMFIFISFVASFQTTVGYGFLMATALSLIFNPSNCFMCGAFTFLVMEQRLTFHAMQKADKEVRNRSLTPGSYIQVRESIDYRDRLSPLNWLVAAAALNTLSAMILIVSLIHSPGSKLQVFGSIVFVLSSFGRQTVVLLLFLYEMAMVNALSETMLNTLVADTWSHDQSSRFDLYILMKEKPLGSSLFFYRPSKLALFIQIGSAIVGIIVAVFWAFVFA